ncbi:uncharacterized protein DUF3105 [Stackebrandtia endophytica]|uniref:Uncharacterized protein DUF3105 n=1 Tax=Stackebrandtia endophytica TaxID=1496996 RepID=A0A543AYZ4_9ACTN|nr:DUF3105 domain-containing protein [Stackebrandtia endophytica]TQL77794.1 uncharacterized protein DUF3105 [Stackebrandtia endophytica]
MAKKKSNQRSGKARGFQPARSVTAPKPPEDDESTADTSEATAAADTASKKTDDKATDAKKTDAKKSDAKKADGKKSDAKKDSAAESDSGTKAKDKAKDEKSSAKAKDEKPKKTDAKSASTKPKGGKGPKGRETTGKAGGTNAKRPAGKSNAKKRKVAAPKKPLPWGMISVVTGLVVVVAALIAIPIFTLPEAPPDPDEPIDGVTDYYADGAPWVEESAHVDGRVEYALAPPAGGNHNVAWSTCNGVVYDQPIPNEHAVHSLEHGAIWFTYSPDLPQTEIDKLAGKVNGIDYTLMSPYAGQDSPIILTAWGYQLKIDSADDERITAFTSKYRLTASREPGATCSGGTPITGDTPMMGAPGMEG